MFPIVLCADSEPWQSEMASASQGVTVLVTSALRGDGMAALIEVIRAGGTTALLGSSGVGKSTLIHALVGGGRQGGEADSRRRRSRAPQHDVAAAPSPAGRRAKQGAKALRPQGKLRGR